MIFYIYLFQKIDFDILYKLSPKVNLQVMSKHIFWKKKVKNWKLFQNVSRCFYLFFYLLFFFTQLAKQ